MDKSTLFMKDHLVALVEAKLSWGKGSTWGNKDFEELSERIFDTTSKRLSVTTLKRIWGRAEWVANPSAATLDILSEFIGYENWREFVRVNKQEPPARQVPKKARPARILMLLLALLLIGSFFGFFWKTDSNSKEVNHIYKSEDFVFTSRSVSDGIPTSVVFEYDATAAREGSKIEIQQDWDARKRVIVDKNDSISTSIYYRPGFFKSKLVVDSTIVKEKDVFITTQDWLGIIESDSIPIYLNTETFKKENVLIITPETLAQYDVDPATSPTVAGFYQVMDFGDLYTDEFEMSALLRNDFKAGISVCQRVRVMIMHEDGPIMLVLSDKGCISDLSLYAFGQQVDGKKNDLSEFGVDFTDYVQLKCISKNQKLTIFVDDKSVYTFDISETPQKIIGISILFEGAGSVKNVEFKKNGDLVYTSNSLPEP